MTQQPSSPKSGASPSASPAAPRTAASPAAVASSLGASPSAAPAAPPAAASPLLIATSSGASPSASPIAPLIAASPLLAAASPGIIIPAVPAELVQPFEPLSDDDADSTLEEDAASSTASIASSILHYRTVNGRTYHSDRVGSEGYWAPNDDEANNFLEIIYHALTLAMNGKLYYAPLPDNIQKVLDIGTGTGIWAIDFADAHPEATVIGTDLSPIQPGWVPPNLFFEIENFEEWSFSEQSVDYIHLRYLVGGVRDWTKLFKDAYKTLKPGGWVESYDFDGSAFSDDNTVTNEMALSKWGDIFQQGCDKLGIGASFSPIADKLIRRGMEAAGFVNIVEVPIKIPISEWAADPAMREIGLYTRAAFEGDMNGAVNMPATQLGWSKEEITVYCARMRKEMRNLKIHAYFMTQVMYGQRPLA